MPKDFYIIENVKGYEISKTRVIEMKSQKCRYAVKNYTHKTINVNKTDHKVWKTHVVRKKNKDVYE